MLNNKYYQLYSQNVFFTLNHGVKGWSRTIVQIIIEGILECQDKWSFKFEFIERR